VHLRFIFYTLINSRTHTSSLSFKTAGLSSQTGTPILMRPPPQSEVASAYVHND